MSTEGHHRVRASDPEREEFVTIVRDAMAEGRLTLEEGEERIARAYAVTYRDELLPLTDDLPGGGRGAPRETPEARAGQRRGARRFPAGRFALVTVVAGLLTVGAVSHGHFPWLLIPLLFVFFALNRRRRFRHWAAASGGWAPGGWGGHGAGGWPHGAPPWADGPWARGAWPARPGPSASGAPAGGPGAGWHGARPDDGEGWGR